MLCVADASQAQAAMTSSGHGVDAESSADQNMRVADGHLSHLLYPLCNDYYRSLGARSASANDVRIVRNSATPTPNSGSSGPSSCAASIGESTSNQAVVVFCVYR